ncbi:hypothetical protein B0T26DRAFT_709736 [Lasiosphaeria miniovina]|uniref:Uncharacterized protein n=1 Tax=Lasiosphaeria miniovina TaxID=1954250 RepID=A0AA40AKB2_9PEZI|nr:uncharacterized protein B0T26DRAFT_709736 [Lasiosphaeria miniovina]KAK0717370.1 hypothetical protein B0T26DRAFT_709736 [Lasiosphaeria miniovina]
MSSRGIEPSQPEHSTLEVDPWSRNDPYKEVVPFSDGLHVDYYGGGTLRGPGGPALGSGNGSSSATKPATIMGLKRRTFFIATWILSLLVGVAIGAGGSLGATMGSRNSCAAPAPALETQNAASQTTAGGASLQSRTASISQSAGTSLGSTTAPYAPPLSGSSSQKQAWPSSSSSSSSSSPFSSSSLSSSSSTSPPSSSPSSRSSARAASPSESATPGGGRCSNNWGLDCVCLDQGLCEARWKGKPYTGSEGNWPCPNEPDNIMACIIKPCLGQVSPTQCMWREGCNNVTTAVDSKLVCPGESDYICCGHRW